MRYQVIEKVVAATIILIAIVLIFSFLENVMIKVEAAIENLNKNSIRIEQLE